MEDLKPLLAGTCNLVLVGKVRCIVSGYILAESNNPLENFP